MLTTIRNSILSRFVWGFMALYLLNISVDSPDLHSNHVAEDLSINDQESIVELVIEKVLGFEDAIPEQDDSDAEDYRKVNISINWVFFDYPTITIYSKYLSRKLSAIAYYPNIFLQKYGDVFSPPPELGLFTTIIISPSGFE